MTNQARKLKITSPEIYINIKVPETKLELKLIVEGHIETCYRYAILCRAEILNLMKEDHELQKN